MKNTSSTQRIVATCPIVGGPDKSSLIDALKYANDKTVSINVVFSVGYDGMPPPSPGCAYTPMRFEKFRIRGIAYANETKGDEDLIVTGLCKTQVRLSYNETEYRTYRFEANYNAEFRVGQIQFLY